MAGASFGIAKNHRRMIRGFKAGPQGGGMEGESKKAARSDLDEAALYFHKHPKPGKLEIQATKPLGNQRDLALAYSPGVAAPCLEIRDDPATAADYPARANLVGVVSNGSAVLGLGNIGPLASKPV